MEAVGQGVGNRIESAREGSFPCQCQCQSSNQEPVSNPSMRVFALRRPVAFLALLFVTILAGAKSTSHRLYPNELKGLKFYAKYLAPFRPGVSREEAVRRVLEICDFISQDNPEATRSKTVLRACDLTCQFSISWSRKERSASPASPFWVVQPYSIYLIVYAPEKTPLQSSGSSMVPAIFRLC